MADEKLNQLEQVSRAIKETSERRENERVQMNEERGEPALTVLDSNGHGTGFWMDKKNGQIIAIRRHSNGYELYPSQVFNVEFLKQLLEVYDAS